MAPAAARTNAPPPLRRGRAPPSSDQPTWPADSFQTLPTPLTTSPRASARTSSGTSRKLLRRWSCAGRCWACRPRRRRRMTHIRLDRPQPQRPIRRSILPIRRQNRLRLNRIPQHGARPMPLRHIHMGVWPPGGDGNANVSDTRARSNTSRNRVKRPRVLLIAGLVWRKCSGSFCARWDVAPVKSGMIA